MGNRCGDLALFAGLSCGAEVVITADTGYDEEEILQQLLYYDEIKKKRHAIVVISEKIANVEELAEKISQATTFSGRSTVLGHVQRGGSPGGFDRLLATKMGDYAVSQLLAGKSGIGIGIKDDRIYDLPIAEFLELPANNRQDLYELHKRLV